MYKTIIHLSNHLKASPLKVLEMAVDELAAKHIGKSYTSCSGRRGGVYKEFLEKSSRLRTLYQELLAAAFLEMHPELSPEDAVIVENHEGNVWTWSIQAKDQGANVPTNHTAIWPELKPKETP